MSQANFCRNNRPACLRVNRFSNVLVYSRKRLKKQRFCSAVLATLLLLSSLLLGGGKQPGVCAQADGEQSTFPHFHPGKRSSSDEKHACSRALAFQSVSFSSPSAASACESGNADLWPGVIGFTRLSFGSCVDSYEAIFVCPVGGDPPSEPEDAPRGHAGQTASEDH